MAGIGYWRSAASALALTLAARQFALAEEYPFDIAKNHPAAMKAWRAVVPADLRKQAWIYKFEGTAGPIDTVTMNGQVFLHGSICIPHDCGGNFVAFLIARDGGEAYGELASSTLGVKQRFFGAPDAEARELLDRALSQ
jgi:hypothetical protein